MLRYFFAIFVLVVASVISLAGFRGQKTGLPPIEIFPDMKHQPKFQPQHPSGFFADGRSARQPVEGTVPQGYNLRGRYLQVSARNVTFKGGFTNDPGYYSTGRLGEMYGDGFPLPINGAVLERGEERFNINCAVCHGRTGAGNGIVQQIGSWATVANLMDDRIRTMPDGQLFSTITNGKNTMGAYGPQIAVEDRWAIVAHIRALQRSQNGRIEDLTAEQKLALENEKK
jgi:hypothetical protein